MTYKIVVDTADVIPVQSIRDGRKRTILCSWDWKWEKS